MHLPRACAFAIPFAILVATNAALAAQRLVPQQYPSIQAAIDASSNGDTITVSPGTYRESLRFGGRSVMIEGAGQQGPAETVILSASGAAVVISDSVAYTGVLGLRNLSINGESVTRSGAAVSVSYLGPNANLLIEGCLIQDWRSSNTDGGALFLGHPQTTVRRCVFERNQSTVHGAAIYAYDGVQAVIEHCAFDGHTVGTGTFYARTNSNLTVRDCVIRNSNTLTAHWQNGTISFSRNRGCSISNLSNGGYVDAGGNDWASCPDCDQDGVLDVEAAILRIGNCADCNGDGLADYAQVVNGSLSDDNFNGRPDVCEYTVTGVIPVSGPSSGGTPIVINGTNFPENPAVLIGGTAATNVIRVSSTRLTALTPPGMPGMTSVAVGNWLQQNAFYYRPECGSDLDQNGVVDGGDMSILLLDWGPCASGANATQPENSQAAPTEPPARRFGAARAE